LAQKLQKLGYKNVYALKDGFRAWQDAGLPVESKRQVA
jgi:rhodanese-related sulfurtransferase